MRRWRYLQSLWEIKILCVRVESTDHIFASIWATDMVKSSFERLLILLIVFNHFELFMIGLVYKIQNIQNYPFSY